MPSTRRDMLGAGAVLFASLAGCSALGAGSTTISELEVELANGRNEPYTFLFAIETPEGLGEWHSRKIPAKTRESIIKTPPNGFDPIAIHGVVDAHAVRGDVLGLDQSSVDEICLKLIFEYGLGDEPTILESSDIRC